MSERSETQYKWVTERILDKGFGLVILVELFAGLGHQPNRPNPDLFHLGDPRGQNCPLDAAEKWLSRTGKGQICSKIMEIGSILQL